MIGDELRRTLVTLIKGNVPKQTSVCQVLSVNEEELTCTVLELGTDMELFNVRLNAAKTTLKSALIPKVESIVLVAIIGNDPRARYVAMVSEIDKVYLNGDGNGGLVKVGELVSKINALESDINALKNVFSSWTTAPNDGGAALKLAATTWFGSTITETTISDIENDKIVH